MRNNTHNLRRGINVAVNAVVAHLKTRAKMISTLEEIAQVRSCKLLPSSAKGLQYGSNVNATRPLTPVVLDDISAPTLLISVPVGTVVKQKKGGKLLTGQSWVGDKYLVARGGQGGISVLEAPKQSRRPLKNVDPAIITDLEDKVLILGGAGEEIMLELTLRVVADVGLVVGIFPFLSSSPSYLHGDHP